MKTKSILTLFLLLFCSVAFACYNGYSLPHTKMILFNNGKVKFVKEFKYYFDDYSSGIYDEMSKGDGELMGATTPEEYNDYGILLIYDKNYTKAKHVFLEIVNRFKSKKLQYSGMANLGTTYELLGKNDSALYWIKKAVELNPDSHEGSEWIHIKILEAKILDDGGVNKKFLEGYNVLGLDWGIEDRPAYNHKINVEDLKNDLVFQLNERLKFIKPKDPIMARLLFDLGTATAFTDNAQMALDIYDKAEEFGYPSSQMEQWRIFLRAQPPMNKVANDSTLIVVEDTTREREFHGFSRSPSDNEAAIPPAFIIVCGLVLLMLATALFFVVRMIIRRRRKDLN